jgi:transcriptional regulator with XRE-family HTH domain
MSKTRFELLTYEQRESHAKRIKSLRLARGLTQDDLAGEAHVSRATINNWENGATVPQPDKLEVVFRALGVQLDESEFEPATQEWLAVMGVLVERIPARDRQPVMNNAITLVARATPSHVGAPYDHQDLPALDDQREQTIRRSSPRMAAKRSAPEDGRREV